MKRPMSSEEISDILLDFENYNNITYIRDKYNRDFNTVKRIILRYYTEQDIKDRERYIKSKQKTESNPMSGRAGMLHHNARERNITSLGYVEVFAPAWYEGPTDGNKCYEHTVVYCSEHGLSKIPEGYVVHHIDEDKTNNNPDNLGLMSIAAHVQFHRKLREGVTTIHDWSSFQEEYEARRNS